MCLCILTTYFNQTKKKYNIIDTIVIFWIRKKLIKIFVYIFLQKYTFLELNSLRWSTKLS